MADMHDYYYGQLVQEDELDEGFQFLEQADWDQQRDTGHRGIVYPAYDVVTPWPVQPVSWTSRQNAPPDQQVIMDTGYAYDKNGKRLAIDPPKSELLNCAVDYLGVSTAPAALNECYLGIFLRFARAVSDARTDDHGATVYFLQEESYELRVRKGGDFLIGTGDVFTDGVPVLSDEILIADILYDATPILNAEIDTTSRVERLMNMDMSAVMPAWYVAGLPAGNDERFLRGRNLDEILYRTFEILMNFGAGSFDVIPTDMIPDTTCTHDLGSATKYWKKLYTQSLDEAPESASGVGSLIPDVDLEGATGHERTIKAILSMGGSTWIPETLDVMGRRRIKHLIDIEDFLYWAAHPGPFPFQINLVGTGTIGFNTPPEGLIQPGGFADLNLAALNDAARIGRASYPLMALSEPSVIWETNPAVTTGDERIEAGMISNGAYYFLMVYDPLGSWNPAPNGNWWCYYDDFINPAIWIDTGVAFAPALPIGFEVAFEVHAVSGNLQVFFYLTQGGTTIPFTADLTALGGTYVALATGNAWDIWYRLIAPAGVGGEQNLVDRYEVRQFREVP